MIFECPVCGQKNRIPERPRTDGVYHCGILTCRTLLLDHKVKFHDRLIRDVMEDLQRIKSDLESIKYAIFRQRDIYYLREEYERSKSRLQNWHDHVEFIRDPIERDEIYGSYKAELRAIKSEVVSIANLISKKEEIKKILQKFKPFAVTLGVLNGALKLAVGVLGITGVNWLDEVQFMLEDIQIFLIEGGIKKD